MKQLLNLLGSMKTTIVLMLIFAFASGYATFIENDYGIMTAKADIYNARWFEILMLILAINLLINIFKFKMFSMKKAPLLIFHVAFIVILIGAAVTRYVGYEGIMHIREGTKVNTMSSSDTYFSVTATANSKKVSTQESLYLSKKSSNSITASLEIDGKKVDVELIKYIPDAVDKLVESDDGPAAIELMVTGGEKAEVISIKEGSFYESPSYIFDFNSNKNFSKEVISIFIKDNKPYMKHTKNLKYLNMDTKLDGLLEANDNQALNIRTLYSDENIGFVLKKFYLHAKNEIVTNPNASPQRPGIDALLFNVTVDGISKEIMIFGQAAREAKEISEEINGVKVSLSYGSKIITIPFYIYLKDFQMDRYPGSMSPSSYASEVTLIDDEQNITFDYRIFMNNILEHRGFRFFQSSYDVDEKGTVLSVNNDPGTLPTYLGYLLLGTGMFWSLFSKSNRFSKLAKKAKDISEKNVAAILISLGLLTTITPAQAEDLNPIVKRIISFDKVHADKFGSLIVQDAGGRMKPVDTLATEIMAKLHNTSSLKVGKYSLTPNQVILGMMVAPDAYRNIKIIKTKNEEINKVIGTTLDAKYASFSQFFEDPSQTRGYKLKTLVDNVIRKQEKHRTKLDKEILKVDERVNIAYSVFTGRLVQLWPKPNDENNKWYGTIESLQTFTQTNGLVVRDLAYAYFTSIDKAIQTSDWSDADKALANISEHQIKYSDGVYPSAGRIAAEMFYNKANIFERLYPFYLLLGFILLIFSFTKILKPNFKINRYTKITLWLLILFFIVHTIGLALRWYISEHAPWSNGYESMIYIGWATVLAGFIFSKRSPMTMASTAILTGLILFVAHLNWMNPQITNLVPVLNSYWLSIHVSMITASYGFLGLGALLGFMVLILFIIKTKSNEKHISNAIKELNLINEMSLMVGIVLLTIGNFLGGVWANESWGRYWGWDPKETWTLVTILVYAIVLHLRFVKTLYTEFNFAIISLLSFSSVIMTYFGVNYYLAGLHSYAKGDPVPVPDFVPITYAIIFVMIMLAFRNRKLV